MKLCSGVYAEHNEVAYSERDCPACEIVFKKDDELGDRGRRIADLTEALNDARSRIAGLEYEVARLTYSADAGGSSPSKV